MRRIAVVSDRIRNLLRDHLAPALIGAGSIRELTNRLNAALPGKPVAQRIHANRIHAIFSADPTQALNEATLSLIEAAVDAMPRVPDQEAAAISALTDRVMAHWWTTSRSSA